jgi:Nif-specific regulatory protein
LKENKRLFKEVKGRFSTRNIIGSSDKIQRILRLIKQISDSSVNVLITGESGTGKELFAKALHYSSPRAKNPFVALNCAALPDNLVESELFGIEKGVATGVEQRIGRFETADGGTLFLDEIGDLSLISQAKILRVLQEGVLERVGSTESIEVDVRILAATNKDLEKKIKNDAFREDLFYRLKVIQIHTPSLREMREDIPLLANYFLDKQCREMKKEPKKFSPGLLKCLSNYSWPGNNRELENEVKSLVVLTHKKIIGEEDLSENILESDAVASSKSAPAVSMKESVEDLEKKMILEAMKLSNQNQIRAAEALGLSRQGLSKKIKRYNIDTFA